QDLSHKELTEKKVLAAVISLMERTYIPIGSAEYEKQNGSHGLTTLHDKHVAIEGSAMLFSFKGKKGIYHTISLKNKKLAKIVKQCRDIPGKELFQYYDENGSRHAIDSGMVNQYVKEYTGEDFTAKDFRTWAGCLNVLRAFKNIGLYENTSQCKQNINQALDYVSTRLGNTRTVCRKYYVHPGIIRLYEENKMAAYLEELDGIEIPDGVTGLTKDETILMKLLVVV
ncbi:MAG: topoisomerase, partial [Sediminibacterium sp.]|nr:topoisomerase [Sediminibacterium sp.]